MKVHMATIIPVIMCGGAGSRLWPLSRAESPKQLHALVTHRSMLAETALRMVDGTNFAPPILIVGVDTVETAMAEIGTVVSGGSAVIEPSGKNTAPCAALACHAALKIDPEAIIALLAADHHIADAHAFRATIISAANLAAAGKIVTLGITPTEAATGFGYIEQGAPIGLGFDVVRFVEKPDRATAQAMLHAGGHYWNAGVFVFRAADMLAEMERLAPEIAETVAAAWANGHKGSNGFHPDAVIWSTCPSDSLDYAIAEKTDRAAMVPFSAGWSDVGSWASLWEIGDKDANENVAIGDTIMLDSKGCYVRAGSRLVTLVGVEDLVVVETNDSVLIVPRARVQEVKRIVEALNKNGRPETKR